MKKALILVSLLLVTQVSFAAESYQSGMINNITSVGSGLMIMMDTGLPTNCEGSPYGWLLIEQKNTTIISVVLTAWASKNTSGTVYTSGRPGGTGYCLVNQFDPAN